MRSFLCLCLVSALPLTVAAQAPTEPSRPAAAATPKTEPHVVTGTREGLGGRLMISVFSADDVGAKAAIDGAFARMLEVEGRLANYLPASEISKVNQAAGKAPVAVSPDTLAVVNRGLELGKQAHGAFALTTAALESLWDFAAARPKKPEPARLRERLARVDDGQVLVDGDKHTIFLKNPNASMSVDGALLGAAADQALALLHAKGFNDALVFVGGDVRATGKKGAKPWVVGVQDPRAVGYFAVMPLQDEAVATVGDYQRFVEIDGERYCDILDPRSGLPANIARSVTVVAGDTVTAHLLALSIFVLVSEEGLKLLEASPNVDALIVDAHNGVTVSPGLKGRLRIVRPPSD